MIPAMVFIIPNFLTVTWLGRIGPIPWINNWPALTIPFMGSIFSIFLLRQFFAQVPDELFDAAQMDGAGHFRFLMQVVLPLSKAPLMVILVLSFMDRPLESGIVIANVITGIPVYYIFKKLNH